MKIIAVDNHNRDYIDDVLVEMGLSEEDAEYIVNKLNNEADPYGISFM
jgi:hypothetical protein